MRRTSLRTRAITAISALAIAGGGLLALAPPASAATLVELGGPTTLSATSSPIVYIGGVSESGADWTSSALPAVLSDATTVNTITIVLTDSAGNNCQPANGTDTLAFAAAPTVTNTTSGNLAAFSAAIAPDGTKCLAGSGVNNKLTLTATTAGASGAVLKLTGIRYAIGLGVPNGKIQVSVSGANNAPASNATVSDVRVTPGAPTLVAPSTAAVPVGNITLTELRAGAIGAGGACVQLQGPGGITFTAHNAGPPVTPAATATGGNGTATTATPAGSNLSFTPDLVSTGTGATAYSFTGVKVDSTATTGRITATVGKTCGATQYSQEIQLGGVGTVDRIAGSTRYATAQKIADTIDPLIAPNPGATATSCKGTVIVANGVNYPDALAASFLAGGTKPTPILLVADTVPTETANAIRQHGVKNITIVGGPNSVSTSIETGFMNQNATDCLGNPITPNVKINVTRIGGADRYATAKAVAEVNGLGTAGTASSAAAGKPCTAVKTAILASGENFPDALAAGVLSAGGSTCGTGGPLPLLLTNAASLNGYTSQALSDMGIAQVILVGGPNTVSINVENAINSPSGLNIPVRRISGVNRQDTAAKLAGLMGEPEYSYGDAVLVTRGDIFPDALVGAPLGDLDNAPLLLSDSTTSLGATAAGAINALPGYVDTAHLLGGTSSLTQAVFDATASALASQTATP